ncbi:MAG: VWA domain-containing protein [Planctomycetes bacterium]|nr:VWA domain-containing protein [Planctomycetota bacterium]
MRGDGREHFRIGPGPVEEAGGARVTFYGITTFSDRILFILDVSGSMDKPAQKERPQPDRISVAKKELLGALSLVGDGHRFNVLVFNHEVLPWQPGMVSATEEQRRRAKDWIEERQPVGGTNIHDALVEALQQPPAPGMLPIVLFLTDGLPTIGNTSEVAIREVVEQGNPHKRRLFTFGVGHDVNVPLLDRIAEVTRSTSTYILPGEDVELKVAQVYRRLFGPVFADPRLETLDAAGNITTLAVRELIPAALPDLFDGDQIVLLGQYRGTAPLRIRLKGSYLGEPREFMLEFPLEGATTRNAFVPRLWAGRRIAFLIDQIRQAGAASASRPALVGDSIFNDPRFRELREEILRLSTEFGILSEYTSFLATEGTDLGEWENLIAVCGTELEGKAVRTRWGEGAVSQGRNNDKMKKQEQVEARSVFYSSKNERVEVQNVFQVADRGLFKRGRSWIDGNVVARKGELTPDQIIAYGTPEFAALLDQLVKDGRQALVARKGEILLRYQDRNILVRNGFEEQESEEK